MQSVSVFFTGEGGACNKVPAECWYLKLCLSGSQLGSRATGSSGGSSSGCGFSRSNGTSSMESLLFWCSGATWEE